MSAPTAAWVNSDVLDAMRAGVAEDASIQLQFIRESYIDMRPPPGCWYWIGDKNAAGYGIVRIRGPLELAHRYLFAAAYGPGTIVGKEMHHVCEVKHCVNPLHLRALTSDQHSAEHGRLRRGRWPRMKCAACGQTRPVKDGVIWTHGTPECVGAGQPPVLEVRP